MRFDYLIKKIEDAEETTYPFRHIQINDFFSAEDFRAITSAQEIALPPQRSDEGLFQSLFSAGYKIIEFPGCITDVQTYVDWHKDKSQAQRHNNTACEGFGVTVRLIEPKSSVITELNAFLASDPFQDALARKFGINRNEVFYDAGIQKYLDGYEISPHPDIRKKALTYMVNINPSANSEASDHHTHYMHFRDSHKYVQSYWEGNPKKETCWVPWSWCESKKVQTENNSIVIFSPSNDTVHAVKANYDHLVYQRTQMYGNLWYHERKTDGDPAWEDFVINAEKKTTLASKAGSILPKGAKRVIKQALYSLKGSGHHKRDL